jgi:hypothetical protein
LFVYKDALRQGRTVVVATVNDEREARAAQKIMAGTGAESIDPARKQWWIGLRDVEKEHYQPQDHEAPPEAPWSSPGKTPAGRSE